MTLDQTDARPLFLLGYCSIKGRNYRTTWEVDGGSDRCIVNDLTVRRLGVDRKKFHQSKTVVGVGGTKIYCDEYCILRLYFKGRGHEGLYLNLLCYIMRTPNLPNLIGSDTLASLGAKIDYGDNTLRAEGVTIDLCTTKEEADRFSTDDNAREIYFHAANYTSIPGREAREVEVVLTSDPPANFVLCGRNSGEREVMSVCYENIGGGYKVGVFNKNYVPMSIKQGEELGFLLTNSDDTVIAYVTDILDDLEKENDKEKDNINDDVNDSVNDSDDSIFATKIKNTRGEKKSGTKDEITFSGDEEGEKEERKEEEEGPCPIPDRRKLSAREMDRFFKFGAKIKGVSNENSVSTKDDWPLESISKEAEIKRSEESTMWANSNDLLKNFDWEKMILELSEDVGVQESHNFAEKLKELFYKYKACFWNNDWSQWTRCRVPDLEIELIDNYTCQIDKYRKLPDEKQEALKGYVRDLLKANVIERSNGLVEFCSNPVIVFQEKLGPDGKPVRKIRFCHDYRSQNKMVKSVSYPLQLIEKTLEETAKDAKYFMSFDLVNYFFLLPLSPKSRKITTFYALGDQYQYTTTPQGIKSIPGLASKVTKHVTRHCENVTGYIDDFILKALTLALMLKYTELFLLAISHFRLMLGPKKVQLVTKTANFLGHAISENNIIRVASNKITSLRDIKSPKNKDELRSILGFLSWYANRTKLRDVMHGMREIAKCGRVFHWSKKLESDLRESIEIVLDPHSGILRAPVTPTVEFPFILFIDSSRYSLGSCLCQIQKIGENEEVVNTFDPDSKNRVYLLQ